MATLRQPGTDQAWDTDRADGPVPKTPYAVDQPCRVQALARRPATSQRADDTETVADYLVVVPAELDPAEQDLVAVTGTDDPLLDGRRLEVQQVVRGSIRLERDLFCTLID